MFSEYTHDIYAMLFLQTENIKQSIVALEILGIRPTSNQKHHSNGIVTTQNTWCRQILDVILKHQESSVQLTHFYSSPPHPLSTAGHRGMGFPVNLS